MKIVVVGGSGFIGTSLCSLLSKVDLDFVIYDKKKSLAFPDKCVVSDVRSLSHLSNVCSGADVIVNLAAEHMDNVRPLSLYDEINVGGAVNVCKTAELHKINRIIFTSSVAVYGFAELGTNEFGKIAPFNDYGRTKWEAEEVLRSWQHKDTLNRSLVIIRPTVVFGKNNRGNVYNLFKQIFSGKFVMIGNGKNRKSIAYVENVVAFIKHSLNSKAGVHVYNYVDKPDFTMNHLVSIVRKTLGRTEKVDAHIPFWLGMLAGKFFDFFALLSGKKFPISSIRVKKFCSNSVYKSVVDMSGFTPPVSLSDAIEETIRHEFLEDQLYKNQEEFFSE